ncbi:head-tail connector protein [Kaistia geumhonensis]|uniref:PhiE125 gp8 family phage protein n=1 Tax=Kaistia geumhonensis TaxID=410839 RepID=A0ABU0M5T4_9HYPH|nr:head-tail connector protein [Kaistia geumhonensis]MCX5478457.1 head-tail connector protein [Kaistia geumhonensis]MDQ0516325.1 putative phiE125 gp8 family phage protein [Kaistia geumhonensis]
MLAPVLITAPAETPVSLAEAKAHCRVDHDDDDLLIEALILAAVGHLDGWSGVLGRALVTQTWRQDFFGFGSTRCGPLRLALSPVSSISSLTYFEPSGAQQALSAGVYRLLTDERGPFVECVGDSTWPSTACRSDSVSVTYVAGVAAADVPAPIKAATLLIVGHLYANREAVAESTLAALPYAVDALIAPYRRVGL